MDGFWSLTFFTILAQAAIGMVFIKAIFGDQCKEKFPCWLTMAIGLTGLATLMSLLHLSAPFSAYYAITNPSTSWLTLEILCVGLFGGLLVAHVFIRTAWMRYLTALAGLLLLYAMSNVYMIEHVLAWNTSLTFTSFLTTALLLGSSTLFLIDLMANRQSETEIKRILHSACPIVIAISLSAYMLVLALQYDLHATSLYLCIFVTAYVLLMLGALLGLITIVRSPAITSTSCPCKTTGVIWLAVLLIWAGAFCGRMLFYVGYTAFGM